jgi:cyclopropane-fatty-acyl-phospholipid synthase
MPLADTIHRFIGTPERVRVEAYDGSAAGPGAAPTGLRLASPRALAYLVRAPGALGFARAFVAGEVDVEGDCYEALAAIGGKAAEDAERRRKLSTLRAFGAPLLRAVMVRAPKPPQEVRLRGRRHSKRRDARAIAHHYDVSNRFYEIVLGRSMAYTCAVFPRDGATLEEAQQEKFDLVCRKLALRPGMRLLDVGCGWGGMVVHAAREYGVTVLGVTLSRAQAEWASKAIAEAGIADRAEVRHLDYRDAPDVPGGYDAISSIGLTEHIGRAQLPAYFRFLYGKLRPGGRLLNHAIMRTNTTQRARVPRGFINRYVFPDGELHGVGHVISVMQNTGFEIRHEENLREHYTRTLAGWCANLDASWDEAVREVGEPTARVWRLYMAGSRLAFERRHIELHQVLGVKLDATGSSGMVLRPDW